LAISLLYMLTVAVSYWVMLVVMTMNAGLFIATLTGLLAGHVAGKFIKKKTKEAVYVPEGEKCCQMS